MRDDLALLNARIWTADPARPWARCVTASSGEITSIDDAARAAGAARVIDAQGCTVTPGLIDTHVHLLMAGESLGQLDLSGVGSRAEFEAAIARRHEQMLMEERSGLPFAGPSGRFNSGMRWLRAHGWSQENWGGLQPDKSWLSAVGDRPVVAYRMDSHVCLVNDAVLRRCDLSRDPAGGRIDRDQRGEPTGLMLEAAAWQLVNPLIPPLSDGEKQAALRDAQRHAHALGLTTVGSMEYQREIEVAYLPQRSDLTLRVRLTLLDRDWPVDFTFGEQFVSDDRLAVIGYKSFLDGTLGSRTARMLEDYADAPGSRGLWCELAASGQLDAWLREVVRRGFQPSMHAIGDAAARRALDAIEAAGGKPGVDVARPRLEHAQTLHDVDLPRFAALGAIASMQPLHKADDGRYAARRLGPGRMRGFFAFRRLLESGARLAFGSDWPIVTCDPMAGIRAAVTGLTLDGVPVCPDENLTVEEALRAYTLGAAFALRFEDRVGSVEVGKLADLTMLDRDPFTLDWLQETPRVVMTVAGGQIVPVYNTTNRVPLST